jgi:hypothetical protein
MAEAEACYLKALEVARAQAARFSRTARRDEPGAALGRAGPADRSPRSPRTGLRLVLQEFKTAALKEAKALLDELV